MKDRITKILERWFISEPALFQVLCTHSIEENGSMACPVRSGRRKVEYNPKWLREMGDEALDQALRTEAVRILLGHPYQRKPDACSQQAVAVGSDLTVGDNYKFGNLNIDRPKDYELQEGQPYEWYARRIQEMLPPSSGGAGDGNGDYRTDRLRSNAGRNEALSELWEEDELTLAMIDGIIESTKDWGSLAGCFAEMLKASTRSRINWRNVLSAKLLVAVDVSGSISSGDLSYFYGVVNSAFRYGFTAVDVIQFDCGVRTVQTLRKVMKDVGVVGRGGTSFQEPIEYAHENGYDGLVMLTDGYAPEPVIPDNMRTKIVWVCRNRESYEDCHRWMEKSGRVCIMELK